MARTTSTIVGGGVGAGTPFALDFYTIVSAVDPPQIATTPLLAYQPLAGHTAVIVASNGVDPDATATEVLRVKGGLISSGAGAGSFIGGKGAAAAGARSIAIGLATDASTGAGNVLIGANIVVPVGVAGSTVVGDGAILTSILGSGSGVCVGAGASIVSGGAASSVCIMGTIQSALGNVGNTVVIGGSYIGAGGGLVSGSVVIGFGATGTSDRHTVVGFNAASNGTLGSAFGHGARANATTATALGAGTNITHTSSIGVGLNATSDKANQLIVGGPGGGSVSEMLIGQGDVAAAINVLIRLTNGSGLNAAAGSLALQAGISTGNAAPGVIRMQTAQAGGSGVGLQTITEAARFDGNATAGESRFMLWDIDNAVLSRVSFGTATDPGFKVLQVPV